MSPADLLTHSGDFCNYNTEHLLVMVDASPAGAGAVGNDVEITGDRVVADCCSVAPHPPSCSRPVTPITKGAANATGHHLSRLFHRPRPRRGRFQRPLHLGRPAHHYIDVSLTSGTAYEGCGTIPADVRVRDTKGPAKACVVVTVKNIGGKTTKSARLDLFVDATFDPTVGDTSSPYGTIPTLAGGATSTLVLSGIDIPANWVDVVVDTKGTVAEYRESNNVRTVVK